MEPNTNTNAVPATKTIPATSLAAGVDNWKLAVRDLSMEDFCIQVTRELLERNALVATKSSAKENPSTYAKFALGEGPTDFRKSLPLDSAQSRRLKTLHGLPMALSFQVAVLDLVPEQSAEQHRRERLAMTAEREAKKVGSISNDSLLQELNKRRVAEGLEPIKG